MNRRPLMPRLRHASLATRSRVIHTQASTGTRRTVLFHAGAPRPVSTSNQSVSTAGGIWTSMAMSLCSFRRRRDNAIRNRLPGKTRVIVGEDP